MSPAGSLTYCGGFPLMTVGFLMKKTISVVTHAPSPKVSSATEYVVCVLGLSTHGKEYAPTVCALTLPPYLGSEGSNW
eukprot:2461529-Pyramimonas_sp.AAC.1